MGLATNHHSLTWKYHQGLLKKHPECDRLVSVEIQSQNALTGLAAL